MKKIILGAILVILLTVGFGVYYLLSNLDSIVKTAIETYGSEATQTTVKVGSVKIGLQDGSGAIYALQIGNPRGFDTPQAFSLGEISTQINLKSLSEEVFVIEQITVRAPEVFFELNQAGKNNLQALKQNLATGPSESQNKETKQPRGTEPKLIIRKLLFTEGKINASVMPLDKNYDLQLPTIELQNLGGKNGGTPAQIADQVLRTLTDRALAEIKKKGLDQYRAKLEGEVNQRLEAGQKQLGEEAKDRLKDVIRY